MEVKVMSWNQLFHGASEGHKVVNATVLVVSNEL
jgi:hypothetical protein